MQEQSAPVKMGCEQMADDICGVRENERHRARIEGNMTLSNFEAERHSSGGAVRVTVQCSRTKAKTTGFE